MPLPRRDFGKPLFYGTTPVGRSCLFIYRNTEQTIHYYTIVTGNMRIFIRVGRTWKTPEMRHLPLITPSSQMNLPIFVRQAKPEKHHVGR